MKMTKFKSESEDHMGNKCCELDVEINNEGTVNIFSTSGSCGSDILQWESVTEHGAVGDGVTDNTSAVLDAMTALPSIGGVVYFPPGTYSFAKDATLGGPISPILIQNKTNISFVGAGPASTVMYEGGDYTGVGDYHLFRVEGTSSYISFHNLRFFGNRQNITNHDEQMHCIELSSGDHVFIDNCWFDEAVGDGIRIIGKGAPEINQDPLDIVDVVRISNCEFKNWKRSGIGFQRANSHVLVTGCHFIQDSATLLGDQGIDFEPSGATSPTNFVIDGNVFTRTVSGVNNTVGMSFGGIGQENNQRFVISNNVFNNYWLQALECEHFIFSNNVVWSELGTGDGRPAVRLIRVMNYCVISNNVIYNPSFSHAGIDINLNNGRKPEKFIVTNNVVQSNQIGIRTAHADLCKIHGNFVERIDTSAGSAGITVNTTGAGLTSNGVSIQMNTVKGYSQGINISPAAGEDIEDLNVSQNILVDCTNGIHFNANLTKTPVVMGNQFRNCTTNINNRSFVDQFIVGGDGDIVHLVGSGNPEGAVTAPVASIFTRIDGGTGTTLYVKEAGSGDTGWVAK